MDEREYQRKFKNPRKIKSVAGIMLKILREKHDLTQTVLALDICKVSLSTYSGWEKCENDVSNNNAMVKAIDFYNSIGEDITIRYIFKGNDEAHAELKRRHELEKMELIDRFNEYEKAEQRKAIEHYSNELYLKSQLDLMEIQTQKQIEEFEKMKENLSKMNRIYKENN